MSTLQSNPRLTQPTLPTIVAAIAFIIAVAAGAYALTSNHPDHTQPIGARRTHAASPYLPTIQTPGAGLAHIVVDPRTGQAHGTVTPPIAATHTRPASPYLPTIQSHRTGPAQIVVDPRTGQAHGTVTPPTNRAS